MMGIMRETLRQLSVSTSGIQISNEGRVMSEIRFIPARLAEKMNEHGYTDKTLAEKVGIGRTTIVYLLKGRKGKPYNPSAQNLRKIADALHTSTDYFVEQDADPSPNQKKMSALIADIAGVAGEMSLLRQQEFRELGKAILQSQKSADTSTIYSELMDLLAILVERDDGESALKQFMADVEKLRARFASSSVPNKRGRTRTPKPGKKQAQSDQ